MSLQSRLSAFITALGTDIKSLSTNKADKAYGGREKIGIPNQSSGVLTIDVSTGNYQVTGAVNANITSWVWQNLPSGEGCCITLFLLMGGTLRTVSTAIGGTVHWDGAAPTHVINKYTRYDLITLDQGSNWFVSAQGGL